MELCSLSDLVACILFFRFTLTDGRNRKLAIYYSIAVDDDITVAAVALLMVLLLLLAKETHLIGIRNMTAKSLHLKLRINQKKN